MPLAALTTKQPITRTSTTGGAGGGGVLPWTVAVSTLPLGISIATRWLLPLDLTSNTLITVTDAGGTLAAGLEVWLQGTLSGAGTDVASAAVGYGTMGAVLTYSAGLQTQFRYLLGRVEATAPGRPGFEFSDGVDPLHFTQLCTVPLRVVAMVVNSQYALYPRAA